MRRAMILASCVVALAGMSPANGAYWLLGGVERYNGPDGIERYQFSLTLRGDILPAFVDDAIYSIESPLGIVFEELVPTWDHVTAFQNGLPGSLDSLVMGTWTLREQIGAEINVYQVTMPAIESNPLWGTPPKILSPADGSVVPPVFVVEVDTPGGYGTSYAPWDPAIDPDISQVYGINEVRFSFEDVPNFQGTTIDELRVNTYVELPLSVTRVSSTGNATFQSSFYLKDWSTPIRLTVAVPEPSSVVLAIIVGVGLVAARRVRAG